MQSQSKTWVFSKVSLNPSNSNSNCSPLRCPSCPGHAFFSAFPGSLGLISLSGVLLLLYHFHQLQEIHFSCKIGSWALQQGSALYLHCIIRWITSHKIERQGWVSGDGTKGQSTWFACESPRFNPGHRMVPLNTADDLFFLIWIFFNFFNKRKDNIDSFNEQRKVLLKWEKQCMLREFLYEWLIIICYKEILYNWYVMK